ncbi:hypothetical protein [Methylomonas fluvii]|nr:hypothetical protein [Methylomonas fluvii]
MLGVRLCPNPYNRPAGIVPLQTLVGRFLGCLGFFCKNSHIYQCFKLIS